jgi:hypothetical protein
LLAELAAGTGDGTDDPYATGPVPLRRVLAAAPERARYGLPETYCVT